MNVAKAGVAKAVIKLVAVAAVPFMAALATDQALAYDNDEQALRLRDTVADPSVPLAWDRRYQHESWRYRIHKRNHATRCGKRYYWDGDECVRKRRWR
ncbi:MAG TPA: hypothetical protein PKD49_12320 [Hyphomicrobium sp.]|nr:hypothetical protein [Hyphomicrobium sp.]